jgi:hypothetical protein
MVHATPWWATRMIPTHTHSTLTSWRLSAHWSTTTTLNIEMNFLNGKRLLHKIQSKIGFSMGQNYEFMPTENVLY